MSRNKLATDQHSQWHYTANTEVPVIVTYKSHGTSASAGIFDHDTVTRVKPCIEQLRKQADYSKR